MPNDIQLYLCHYSTVICRQATLGQKKEAAGDWDSSGVKLDSLDIVRDTAAAINERNKYLQAQPRVDEGSEDYLTPVVKELLIIRERHKGKEWGWIAAYNVTDSLCATLLLLGREGKGTFTHANWSEALHIGFAFDEVTCIESPVPRVFWLADDLHSVMPTCILLGCCGLVACSRAGTCAVHCFWLTYCLH